MRPRRSNREVLVKPPGRRSHHPSACDCGTKPTRKGDSQRKASDDLERRLGDLTAELDRAKAALEAETVARQQFDLANARLAAIVESSPDAILSETLSGIVTSWNKAAERIFGYTATEIRGRSTSVLIPSDRTDELESLVDRAKRGKAVKSFETECLRKDGRRIEVSLTLLPILDETGNLAGISAIFRETSEQKCLEKVLRESENRLKAIMDNSPAMIVF